MLHIHVGPPLALVRLAEPSLPGTGRRCYLCAKRPEKADDVLSAFLNGTSPTPPVGHSGGGAIETPEPGALRGGNAVPRKFAGGVSREELLAAR